MHVRKMLTGFVASVFLASSVNAWQCHFLLTYPILLEAKSQISQTPFVFAETLSDFLAAESEGLVSVLKDIDTWPGQVGSFPVLPPELEFKGKSDATRTLLQQFTDRARIHPQLDGDTGMHYDTLFVEYAPQETHRINNPLEKNNVILGSLVDHTTIPNPPLERVSPGQLVSPLEIISSAVDEPDFGMDVNLWEDSQTEFGQRYKLGSAPSFIDPTLAVGTQAPFHLGYYHEGSVITSVNPAVAKTYSEYRIHFFLTLSRYAFSTGHDYWGYRFLGWALHYIQDLTQPYHAKIAPGYSDTGAILSYLFASSRQKNTIVNEHLALENYAYYAMMDNLTNNGPHPLLDALTANHMSHAATYQDRYPVYSDSYPRDVISQESYNEADKLESKLRIALNQIIQMTFPYGDGFAQPSNALRLDDLLVNLYSKANDPNVSHILGADFPIGVRHLNDELVVIFQSIGAHTRKVISYVGGVSYY